MANLFLQIFFTIFIVIDPLGFVPLFISATGHLSDADKIRTIRKAIAIAFFVLSLFILAGRFILAFFGISPGAFYIAGGVLFFLIAIDMLFGQSTRSKTSSEEAQDDAASLAIFPLAIPMISGPGAITTIMLYSTGNYDIVISTLMLFGAVILTLGVIYASARASKLIIRTLGKTGVSVVARIMGLLLSGLSIQFVFEGLSKLGIVKP